MGKTIWCDMDDWQSNNLVTLAIRGMFQTMDFRYAILHEGHNAISCHMTPPLKKEQQVTCMEWLARATGLFTKCEYEKSYANCPRFWVLWGEMVASKHDDLRMALNEAKRLSRAYPSRKYYIAGAIKYVVTGKTEVFSVSKGDVVKGSKGEN